MVASVPFGRTRVYRQTGTKLTLQFFIPETGTRWQFRGELRRLEGIFRWWIEQTTFTDRTEFGENPQLLRLVRVLRASRDSRKRLLARDLLWIIRQLQVLQPAVLRSMWYVCICLPFC